MKHKIIQVKPTVNSAPTPGIAKANKVAIALKIKYIWIIFRYLFFDNWCNDTEIWFVTEFLIQYGPNSIKIIYLYI